MKTKLILHNEDFLRDAVDLADELVDARGDEDRILEALSRFFDEALPFDVIIPGAAGVALERVDGVLIERLGEALVKLFKVDPKKRAERKLKRASRKADRAARD